MKIQTLIPLLLLLFPASACEQQAATGTGEASTIDESGYELTPIPGTHTKMAVKKDQNGRLVEEGLLRDGKKEGTWVTYHTTDEKQIAKSVQGFHNGLPNGVLIEYGNRGQLEKIAHYLNGKLHGRYATYDYGRIKEIRHYKNGLLDGLYIKNYPKSDKIQSEAEFKNGKQDGFYRYYDEEGKVVMEYQYRNGEKVSGGMKQ